MLNVAVLIGRLTRDRALRSTPSGQALASCTLAVDGPFANQQGERETDFVDVVCWRTLAETVTGHVGKGALVAVQGRAQVRSYETKDGQRRKATEVVADTVRFLEPKGVRAERGGAASEGIAGDNPGVRAMCPPEAEAAQTEPPADPPEESAGVSSVALEIDLDACELDALPTFLDGNLDQLGPLADHCPRRAPPRARRSPERLRDALLARWAWAETRAHFRTHMSGTLVHRRFRQDRLAAAEELAEVLPPNAMIWWAVDAAGCTPEEAYATLGEEQ